MKSRDFCFWLQGLFEVANPTELTPQQTAMIRAHLDLVFKHDIAPAAREVENKIEVTGDPTKAAKAIEDLFSSRGASGGGVCGERGIMYC